MKKYTYSMRLILLLAISTVLVYVGLIKFVCDISIEYASINICNGNYLGAYDLYMDVYGIKDKNWNEVWEAK